MLRIIAMADLNEVTDWRRLKEMLAGKAFRSAPRIDQDALLTHLSSRVRGQERILQDLAKFIRLQTTKQEKDKPIASFLFLGPTGTGKTELAKALTEFLFTDEKAMVRFDCSELGGAASKTRLIGTPIGYVGSEQGGQLTRPVMMNPRRLILFDEIEKAYPPITDLFLQLMGEGRLTEQGSGNTVDYSQCIIILTSNAHAEQIAQIQAEARDYYEMVNAIKSYLAESKVFRPEILGRIDKVYVFQPLEGLVVAEIALLKLSKLASEYGLHIEFVAPELIVEALAANEKLTRFGIRELERIVFDTFAAQLIEAKDRGISQIELLRDEQGKVHVRSAS